MSPLLKTDYKNDKNNNAKIIVIVIISGYISRLPVRTVCCQFGQSCRQTSAFSFCSLLSLLLISLGCHPLEGFTPTFYLSDLVCQLFFLNLSTIFFVRVSPPPGGCHPGRSPRPLVTPLGMRVPSRVQWHIGKTPMGV